MPDNKILTGIKKTHAEWDRKKREFAAVIAACVSCTHTRDNKFQGLLQALVEKASGLDAKLLSMECDWTQNIYPPEADALKVCGELAEVMKQGQKFAVALKTLIKAAPSQ